jgi:hypothetical protein
MQQHKHTPPTPKLPPPFTCRAVLALLSPVLGVMSGGADAGARPTVLLLASGVALLVEVGCCCCSSFSFAAAERVLISAASTAGSFWWKLIG